MGLFGNKKDKGKSLSKKRYTAERICQRRLKYATERINGEELVIGKEGFFNVRDDIFIVTSSQKIVFRCHVSEMETSDLMSLGGTIITAPDIENDNKIRTIIVYYINY